MKFWSCFHIKDKYGSALPYSLVKPEPLFERFPKHGNLRKLLHVGSEPNLVSKMADIFSILSKEDALTIFISAKNGLESELDTPKKIDLTKKQYYTRLKQLVELGLLNKNDNKYFHTALGRIVYEKHLLGLLSSMKISKELEMVDLLKKSSKFRPEEIDGFIHKLNPDVNNGTYQSTNKFEVVQTLDVMVNEVVKIIESAEHEILLSTRFKNELIINAILKKAQRNIVVKIISDVNMVNGYFSSEGEKALTRDTNTHERINVVANPFYPSKVERLYFKVPYCMVIVDREQIGLEIVNNYEPDEFKMAIFGKDKNLSSQMAGTFESMCERAWTTPTQMKQLK